MRQAQQYGLVVSLAALLAACGSDGGDPGPVRGALIEAPASVATVARATVDASPARALVGAAAKCDVRVVGLNYATPGVRDEGANASAAMLVPTGTDTACQGPFPLLAYSRGTEVTRARTMANPSDPETSSLIAFFAAQGYAVVATDYLGYAKSTYSYHPYLHSNTEAGAVVDSIRAARAYAAANAVPLSGKLMLYGYSQGGHSSLSTQKAIETDAGLSTEMAIAAAGHGAAPSALSTSLATGAPILYGQVFVPFIITAWQKVYGNVYSDVNQVFKQPYATGIENLLPSTQYDFTGLITNGKVPPVVPNYQSLLFQDAFLADLVSNPNNGVIAAARQNDLVASGWNPRSATMLCAGRQDPVVIYTTAQQVAANKWGAQANVQVVDVDAQAQQLGAQQWAALTPAQQQAAGNQATYVTLNYHGTLAPPFCYAAVKSFFDARR